MSSKFISFITVCCGFYLSQASDLKITIEPPGPQVWFIEGRPFNLTCTVYTDTDEKISWTRNEEEVKADEYEIRTWTEIDANGTRKSVRLTKNVTGADEIASFRCFAGSSDQVVRVENFYVYISGGNVTEESDTTLKCNPHMDYQNKAVSWYKDGIPLNEIPDLKGRLEYGHENTTVSFQNAKLTDSGAYTCRIEINPGAYMSQVFLENVSLQGKPYIANSNAPKLNMMVTDSSTVLKCPAAGYPSPAVFWLRDGEALDISDRMTLTPLNGIASGQLEIQTLTEADFGQYTCVAENALGQATLPFDVRNNDHHSLNSALNNHAAVWFVSSMMTICTLAIAVSQSA